MSTSKPASVINNAAITRISKLGTLQVGAPADVSIMHLAQAASGQPFAIQDTLGHSGVTTQKFVADAAFRDGVLISQ